MSKKNRNKNNSTTRNKRAAKKDAVLGKEKNSRLPLLAGLCFLMLAAAGAVYFFMGTDDTTAVNRSYTQDIEENLVSQISYPLADFRDGSAVHYEYNTDKETIRYFILKSSDGVIRAAFDACDVCWPANKGYYQDGDEMVCRNCSRRFPSIRINEVKGGCNPAPLVRNISGDNVVIRVEDILKGKKYFDFS